MVEGSLLLCAGRVTQAVAPASAHSCKVKTSIRLSVDSFARPSVRSISDNRLHLAMLASRIYFFFAYASGFVSAMINIISLYCMHASEKSISINLLFIRAQNNRFKKIVSLPKKCCHSGNKFRLWNDFEKNASTD